MSVKFILDTIYHRIKIRVFSKIRMEIGNDSDAIKSVFTRMTVIKRKLLALTEEVGQVQSALLNIQSKSTSSSALMGNQTRSFSTSTIDRKRKIKLPDEYIVDGNESSSNSASQIQQFKKHKLGFIMDNDNYVQVYTDGACENNGYSNAKAGLGVWFGENHSMNISEPVSGRATNNCGEIQACTAAINAARIANVEKLCINTDSQFVINSMTKWIDGWKKKGWKKADGAPVKNKEDFEALDNAVKQIGIVKWNYVPAHKGIQGNEGADRLAAQGAAKYSK